MVQTERILVKCFEGNHSVASYRTPVPSEDFQRMLNEVHTYVRMQGLV